MPLARILNGLEIKNMYFSTFDLKSINVTLQHTYYLNCFYDILGERPGQNTYRSNHSESFRLIFSNTVVLHEQV